MVRVYLLRVVSHDVFSDTANFPLSPFDERISQYSSIVHVRNGENAFHSKSVEAVGKHHDVSAKVVIPDTQYTYISNC